jgi:hypothetical protein
MPDAAEQRIHHRFVAEKVMPLLIGQVVVIIVEWR